MDNQRFFLLLALTILAFWTWMEWNAYFDDSPEPVTEQAEERFVDDDVPTPDEAPDAPRPDLDDDEAPVIDDLPERVEGERIEIVTASKRAVINTLGGELLELDLLDYREDLDQEAPVRLLDSREERLFVLQPGLIAAGDSESIPRTIPFRQDRIWSINADGEEVAGNEDAGKAVRLVWESEQGLRLYRTFKFLPGSYQVKMEQRLENRGEREWRGGSFVQIERTDPLISRSMFNPSTFSHNGPAYHDGDRYERLSFSDLASQNLQLNVQGGWAAMVEHYFVATLIPQSPDHAVRYYTRHRGANRYLIGMADQRAARVQPGENLTFNQTFYLGPKIQRELREAAPNLERVVDYGIMWIIAQPLFIALSWIHKVVGNWGWAIILLTVLIKLAFYKLSETSGRSIARMRKLQPRLQTIRDRYKDDKQKMNQAMMELYKREKVNPAAGCLPILIQIPVFIALYWCLLESAELRHAPWMLWIQDLSSPDPFYILPVIMGASMFFQQKLNPPPPDPMMQKMLMLMPLMLIGIGIFMPAGLVLYWAVNTILSAAQQWKINRVVESGMEK
ncbi:membrane protein insertase YidC [Natronospira bacteriovora]|uniref:Membrane protein insertase YidC n=1 Tax=Natronospira bacteriovora TaxID=3069753 RepID=A0ABU0W6W8_9GAMM|nr:membrane protein insertase YidC [Natronospira sp. AB-CW4]MDQ2069754.1 membrane protein insertase YidC [Natronospira sp. AB-CW4]